jgi:syntaxin 5
LFYQFQFSQGAVTNTLPPSTLRSSPSGSLLMSERDDQISIDMSSPLLPHNQLQQQQMLVYDESDNYVQQRAETMQSIESTIVELGGIFQQLAVMVKEQEEMVERIDTNIQDVEINVEAAHSEILKYFQSISKNRWLMIKIFGVLIFFFIFFVIFVV